MQYRFYAPLLYLSGAFQAGDKLCDCAGVYGTLHDYRPDFVEKLGANVQLASLFNSLTIITSVVLLQLFHYNKWLIDVGLNILV